MFDQMTQTIRVPGIIYNLAFLYFCIQLLATSLWVQQSNVWSNSGTDKLIVRWVQYIALWTTDDKTGNVYYMVLVAASVLFLLSAGFFAFQMITFVNRRRFYHWTLYPTRLCIEVVPFVIMHPIGHLVGRFLRLLAKEPTATEAVCFAVSVVLFLICTLIYWVTTSLISQSAYLPMTPWASLDKNPMVLIVVIDSMFVALSVFSTNYPSWLIHFICTGHLGFMLFHACCLLPAPVH